MPNRRLQRIPVTSLPPPLSRIPLAVMVKPLTIMKQGDKLHIEGYPDAVAMKRIDDPIAKQLQAMALHRFDLSFCRGALAEIAGLDRSTQPLLAEALWVSCIRKVFQMLRRQ